MGGQNFFRAIKAKELGSGTQAIEAKLGKVFLVYFLSIFRVPYYAPPPGYNGYPQSQQQHPPPMPQPMYGQIPPGMHPSQMPMPGMPPMPMTPVPMHSSGGHVPTASPSNQATTYKLDANSTPKTSTENATSSPPPNVVNKPIQMSQVQITRASWTFTEEEILVDIYAEFTMGKKLRKMNKKTWDVIAERLFHESQKQMPRVAMKSWMQCKDKWNNMVKKHKYHRDEHYRRLKSGDHRAIERSAIFETVERIIKFENRNNEHSTFPEQDGSNESHESATMVEARNGPQQFNSCEAPPAVEEDQQRNEGDMNFEIAQESNGPAEEREITENDQEEKRADEVGQHETEVDGLLEMGDESSLQELQSFVSDPTHAYRKRQIGDSEENHESKRTKKGECMAGCMEDNLVEILTRQTEFMERAHAQHCELLQQMRMSEENTRMMLLQGLKDLGTILNRLIKTENS